MKFLFNMLLIISFIFQMPVFAEVEKKMECFSVDESIYEEDKRENLKLDSFDTENSKNAYKYLLLPGEPSKFEASELGKMINPNEDKTAELEQYIPKSF